MANITVKLISICPPEMCMNFKNPAISAVMSQPIKIDLKIVDNLINYNVLNISSS